MKKVNKGFTLIELLVVIGIIAILAAIVIVSINPAKRFQDARNAQRQANVEAILGAVQQAIVDNKGIMPSACDITATKQLIAKGSGGAEADLANTGCLPAYLAVLPYDPSRSGAKWTDASDYNTGYEIVMDTTTKQVTVSAPESLLDGKTVEISVTR
jgi:prepilin-type N-terminal cleavage/methylation domain-containing protein